MIPRYSRPEMVAIWSPETRFRIWFEIEAHATDALADLGVVPKEAARAIWERGGFDVVRIDEIEAEVKQAWLAEQKAQASQQAYGAMRAKYTVLLPAPKDGAAPAAPASAGRCWPNWRPPITSRRRPRSP